MACTDFSVKKTRLSLFSASLVGQQWQSAHILGHVSFPLIAFMQQMQLMQLHFPYEDARFHHLPLCRPVTRIAYRRRISRKLS